MSKLNSNFRNFAGTLSASPSVVFGSSSLYQHDRSSTFQNYFSVVYFLPFLRRFASRPGSKLFHKTEFRPGWLKQKRAAVSISWRRRNNRRTFTSFHPPKMLLSWLQPPCESDDSERGGFSFRSTRIVTASAGQTFLRLQLIQQTQF